MNGPNKSDAFLSFTRRSVAWVRFERQRGRMRERSIPNRGGRKSNVKRKAKAPMKPGPGRLANRRKRWVSRIWLDTVLAGEREKLISLQINQGMIQPWRMFKSTTSGF